VAKIDARISFDTTVLWVMAIALVFIANYLGHLVRSHEELVELKQKEVDKLALLEEVKTQPLRLEIQEDERLTGLIGR